MKILHAGIIKKCMDVSDIVTKKMLLEHCT